MERRNDERVLLTLNTHSLMMPDNAACLRAHETHIERATARGGTPEWLLQLNFGNTDLES